MMRLRSSSRCCRRLIEPIWRCSTSFLSWGSATSSGIVIPRYAGLQAFGKAVQRTGDREIIFWIGGLQSFSNCGGLVGGLVQFQFADFIVNLILKVAAGSPEFSHELAHLASDFRKTPRPEKDQGEQHQKEHFTEAEIHSSMAII